MHRTRTILSAAAAIVALTATGISAGAAATDQHPSSSASRTALGATVTHTGTKPTGYTVTFRFRDASADRVQIKGEWYFGDPWELSALAGTSTETVATPGTTPARWSVGDIPLPSPNSSAANWPVVDMKRGANGVWTYTTPLPSGVFNYGFFVDCDDAAQSECAEIADPAEPAWNVKKDGTVVGGVEPVSQVYVPSDSRFGTEDLSWQAPAREQGALRDLGYPAPLSTAPATTSRLAVYTPPGYDAHRAEPYPTVYLFSGGSNEIDWSTQGAVTDILDNLIGTGQIQPMVVVMPSAEGFPADAFQSLDATVADAIVPFVEKHYRVSTDAADRAIGGLGYGASIANSVLERDPALFGSYGIMSPGLNAGYLFPDASALTADQVAVIGTRSILVGGGLQDPSHWFHAAQAAELTSLGVTVQTDFVNGGHNWYAWRIGVRDFLTRVAFFPPLGG